MSARMTDLQPRRSVKSQRRLRRRIHSREIRAGNALAGEIVGYAANVIFRFGDR